MVEGIEFRSVTVTARKDVEGPRYETNQAVIYRGPWKRVEDDDGNVLQRGERAAVCSKTYRILTSEPYADRVIPIPSRVEIAETENAPFDATRTAPRSPRETKGEDYRNTTKPGEDCCEPKSCC